MYNAEIMNVAAILAAGMIARNNSPVSTPEAAVDLMEKIADEIYTRQERNCIANEEWI